jgi:hypothetical protein
MANIPKIIPNWVKLSKSLRKQLQNKLSMRPKKLQRKLKNQTAQKVKLKSPLLIVMIPKALYRRLPKLRNRPKRRRLQLHQLSQRLIALLKDCLRLRENKLKVKYLKKALLKKPQQNQMPKVALELLRQPQSL